MPDNVEVGVWLSGGVDSSVIAALARPFVDRLYTFSAGVEGAPDLEYARMVAKHMKNSRTIKISEKEINSIRRKSIYTIKSLKIALDVKFH